MSKDGVHIVSICLIVLVGILAFGGNPSDKEQIPPSPSLECSEEWRYYESPNMLELPPKSEVPPELVPEKILSSHIADEYKVKPELAAEIVELVYAYTDGVEHIEPPLVLAIIAVESSFRPHAKSEVGAKGLMQVMPFNGPGETIEDNILKGIYILQTYHMEFDDLIHAVMSYNIGNNAFKKGKRNYNYVEKVFEKELEYKELVSF